MKRYGNLYNKICSLENLQLADIKARKCKKNRRDIIEFDKNKDISLLKLQESLINYTYKTSTYHKFKLYDPKEREVYKLPYYPDRIVHHAILNIIEPIFVSSFISNTFNCIKGRGIHKALFKLNKNLKDINNTQYCLKIDIKKFYPSINNSILKSLLRKKFKDKDLLWLLDEIIDSINGVPIGNYLSQFFANFYLNYFDHWIKEKLKIKYYFRYCDDIVILHSNKQHLHNILSQIKIYISSNLKLELKSNYQIYFVKNRGIDFVGYKSYHTHILLRKSIKKRFIKMIRTNYNSKSINSYNGWLKYCNSINLRNKYIK